MKVIRSDDNGIDKKYHTEKDVRVRQEVGIDIVTYLCLSFEFLYYFYETKRDKKVSLSMMQKSLQGKSCCEKEFTGVEVTVVACE